MYLNYDILTEIFAKNIKKCSLNEGFYVLYVMQTLDYHEK